MHFNVSLTKTDFFKIRSQIITWNRDCNKKKEEKKQDPACCYQTLTKTKNQGSNKPDHFRSTKAG